MKQITLKNLIADRACELGLEFATPILEANGDVPSEILAAGQFDWFEWLVERCYNVESARRNWRTWNEKGYLILTGGRSSALTGGDFSTLTGGRGSILTGGRGSTLTGGYGSQLTGGDSSTLTGGEDSILTGGNFSTLSFRYCDGASSRIVVAYVSENGIEPNVAYNLNESGLVVRAEETK